MAPIIALVAQLRANLAVNQMANGSRGENYEEIVWQSGFSKKKMHSSPNDGVFANQFPEKKNKCNSLK